MDIKNTIISNIRCGEWNFFKNSKIKKEKIKQNKQNKQKAQNEMIETDANT